jgi:cytochrome P450
LKGALRETTPVYDGDLFSEEAILDPYERYREMRNLGPVVWVARQEIFALPRYEQVRAALGNAESFISGCGVALNDFTNQAQQGTTLASDGEEHRNQRSIVAQGLNPHALRGMRESVENLARELVDGALESETFDAVEALAQEMPLQVVPDLLGWEEEVRPHLLSWAEAAFDTSGPLSPRNEAKLPAVGELIEYATTVSRERRVAPQGLGAKIIEAADEGRIEHERCPALMLDFLGPSLDTTASALGAALYLFATRPEQWQKIREDHSLIPNAINEVVRWQSPVRFFTRVAPSDIEIAGTTVPAGARLLLMFASANRDERAWDRPDDFDVERENVSRQVGFGYGVHACAGQGLSRLEMGALLNELAGRVERIELTGKPTVGVNSIIRAFESLPIRLVAA